MITKPKSQKTSSSTSSRCGTLQSYVLGFLTAVLIGYFLLYNHFIQIAAPSSESPHSKGNSLTKSSLRAEEKAEIQQLLRNVDQLYEKMKLSRPQQATDSRVQAIKDPITLSAQQIPQSRPQSGRVSGSIRLRADVGDQSDYKGLKLDALQHHLSADHSKDVVFALAANIDPKYFAIFVKSFRKHNKEASMFVFVNSPVEAKVRQLADANDVMLIEYAVAELQPSFLHNYHPSSLRWILYDRILRLPLQSGQAFGSVVEKILALDARDSAFQRDPFALFSSQDDKLLVFGEERHSTIGQCGWNSAWVKDCFPRSVYDQVASRPIICSGISMGAASAMARYVQRMAKIISGEESQLVRAADHFPSCERNGVDQGIHNVLVHALDDGLNVQVLYPEDFPVVNMQSGREQTVISDERGPSGTVKRVYMKRRLASNPNEREAFAVVHQFDRDNDLQASLAHEFVDWIDWSDTKSEWGATAACAKMSYIDQADLFKAMCDIGAARAISAATCCEACARKSQEGKQCTGFTYYGGVCFLKNCDLAAIRRQVSQFHGGGSVRMRLSGALTGYNDPSRA